MTPHDIVYRRLANQQIARPEYRTPHEMVAWLGAIQAQDYLGALWAIGRRRQQQLELDDKIIARIRTLFIRALQGGKQLTRDEVYALLESTRISSAGQGVSFTWFRRVYVRLQ